MTISKTIRALIENNPFGTLIMASTLLKSGLGTRAAIDQTLSRLARSGFIERLSRGIYTKPRITNFGGRLLPSPEQIARAFAVSTQQTALPVHGAEAARRFGLTTQMLAEVTFLTRGSSRLMQLKQLQLRFLHASKKHFLLAGQLAGEAISALLYVGRRETKQITIKQIKQKLGSSQWQALLGVLEELPKWLRDRIAKLLQFETRPLEAT